MNESIRNLFVGAMIAFAASPFSGCGGKTEADINKSLLGDCLQEQGVGFVNYLAPSRPPIVSAFINDETREYFDFAVRGISVVYVSDDESWTVSTFSFEEAPAFEKKKIAGIQACFDKFPGPK